MLRSSSPTPTHFALTWCNKVLIREHDMTSLHWNQRKPGEDGGRRFLQIDLLETQSFLSPAWVKIGLEFPRSLRFPFHPLIVDLCMVVNTRWRNIGHVHVQKQQKCGRNASTRAYRDWIYLLGFSGISGTFVAAADILGELIKLAVNQSTHFNTGQAWENFRGSQVRQVLGITQLYTSGRVFSTCRYEDIEASPKL